VEEVEGDSVEEAQDATEVEVSTVRTDGLEAFSLQGRVTGPASGKGQTPLKRRKTLPK